MQALEENKKFFVFRLSLILFIANVIGALTYVRAVEPSWVIPEERAAGIHTVTGEPIVWAGAILPFIIGFGLLDAFWGVCLLILKKRRSSYFWLAAAVIWIIAIVIDFAHH
jgi:hypothetical protein